MEDKFINTITKTETQQTPEPKIIKIVGQKPLKGHVNISGAKNSALVIIAGAILSQGRTILKNVPNLVDVNRMAEIIATLGAKVERLGNTLEVDSSNLSEVKAPYELVSQLRASFFLIGPLLARLGVARVPLPGGCAIGARPVEFHVRGLQAMGATVEIDHGLVHAYLPSSNPRLKGAKIYLDYPSVGATETLMMAATLAHGETKIENAAQEPEVCDLANFLNSMGARIEGFGSNTITIHGVDSLHDSNYNIIPDRIEAGTFMIASAVTKSELTLSPVIPEHLSAVINKLQDAGTSIIQEQHDTIRVIPNKSNKAIDVETLPYPGFPTDMQPQFMVLLALSEGNSVITETVFENRLRHVAELNRMGADIRIKGNNAIIRGVPMLYGAPVEGTDLRATAALIIAGLAAEGVTKIDGLHHLDRGYEHLEQKFQAIGADIERINL